MKDQWTQLNIDLDKLSESIKQFFTENQFAPTLVRTKNGYRIEAALGKTSGTRQKIQVNITGKPDNFTADFSTVTDTGKGFFTPRMILSFLTTAFGGGIILKYELEQKEALDRIEKMFWECVDKQIASLTNTPKK
jgi:hypothetical protein